jgi:hypothetical protein
MFIDDLSNGKTVFEKKIPSFGKRLERPPETIHRVASKNFGEAS